MAHIDPTVNHCSILLVRIKHRHTCMYTHIRTYIPSHALTRTDTKITHLPEPRTRTDKREEKADAVYALAVSLSTLVSEGI